LAGGTTAAIAIVAIGATGMRVAFGDGYGSAVSVALVMALTETIRSMYRPFFRVIQSNNGIGPLRYWFAASMVAQIPLAIAAASRWSTAGVAVAALACSAVFEAAPVALRLRLNAQVRSPGTLSKPVLRQAGAVICAGCFVVLLAWGRQRLGLAAMGLSAVGALMAGILTLHRITRYLAAARPLTNSSLMPNPGSLLPDLEEN